ncbi:MAG: hypothetical protein ACR2OY_13890 [Boseongicola sp.]
MIGSRFLATISVVVALAGTATVAETLTIQGGDHDGFTRLVLEFSTRPEWRAGRTEAGYAVGFAGTDLITADLSQVFRRIRRDKVANVDLQSDYRVLELSLACNCSAEIYDYGESAIIIDIRSGPPRAKALHEAPFAPELPAVSRPQLIVKNINPPPVLDAAIDLRPAFSGHPPRRENSRLPKADALLNDAVNSTAPRNEAFALPLSGQDGVFSSSTETALNTSQGVNSAAVAAVAEQLSRAAIQGLIDPTEAAAAVASHSRLAQSQPGPTNFRALTSVDRDTDAAGHFFESTRSGAMCIADNKVSIRDWGDPTDPRLLGQIRHAAIAENGHPTNQGRLDLAHYYLVLGFGSEAIMVAERLPPSVDHEIIIALGEIIDSGTSDATILDGQLACSGEIALWAALARPFRANDLPQSPDAILAVFSALPRHLREHLGPVLSERLRTAGQTARARTALNAVTRAGHGSVQQELTAARLGLTDTGAVAARVELERLSRGTDFSAAEALLELLLDADRRGVAPKPAWVEDAPSLIRVTDGTDVGDRLSVAALQGHIPLGRFDELRLAINEDLPGLNNTVRTRIAARALATAVSVDGDADFLRAEIGFSRHAVPSDIDGNTRLAIAGRLLSMGLAALAGSYLPDELESDPASALAARVLNATGQKGDAIAVAPSTMTPEYSIIRANLFEESGLLTDASREFLAAENEGGAVRTALRSGDWHWIVSPEGSPLSGAVQNILAENSPLPSSDNSTANAQLIDGLAIRRAAYDKLLASATISEME